MDGRTARTPDSSAAVEAIAASVAVLAAFTGDAGSSEDTDPLRRLADGCLDGLAEVARLEARTAALKAQLAAEYVQAARSLASRAAASQERTARELALVAELACVLTVSERTAGAFLSECQALTTCLPLTLAALQAGTISWHHARIPGQGTHLARTPPPGQHRRTPRQKNLGPAGRIPPGP